MLRMSEVDDGGDIEPIYERIGKRLATLRKERGLTQEVLSDRAGVSANYLARTEGGYHRPNLAKIEGIAEALEVSMASLFTQRAEPLPDRVLPTLLSELSKISASDQRLVLQLVRRLRAGSELSPESEERRRAADKPRKSRPQKT